MKSYNVLIEDRVFTGSGVQVIEELHRHKYFKDVNETMDDFAKQIPKNIWRLFRLSVVVKGNTREEQYSSLVDQLIMHGLLREVN